MENSLFETQNKKNIYIRKISVLEYFKVKFFIKILTLVKLLLKFNKQILSLSVNVVKVGLPC